MQVMRRCQCTPKCLIALTIGMLIAGGMCVILLPSKSPLSADEICSNLMDSSDDTMSNFNKPLKRTHRVDTLDATNLTYLEEHDQIIDAFNQSILDLLHIARTVEESLTTYSHTQELIDIIYRLKHNVQNCIKDLRNLQTRLAN